MMLQTRRPHTAMASARLIAFVLSGAAHAEFFLQVKSDMRSETSSYT